MYISDYSMIGLAGGLLIWGFLLVILYKVVFEPSSYKYRKHLTNLYVAGRIKQEAEKDNVNLIEMEKDFSKFKSEYNGILIS